MGYTGAANEDAWVADKPLHAPRADYSKSFGSSLAATDTLLVTGAPETAIALENNAVKLPLGTSKLKLAFTPIFMLFLLLKYYSIKYN